MGSGDKNAAKNELSYQKSRYEGQIDPFMSTASSNYQSSVPQARSDYNNIMGKYNDIATTGGYSPQNIADLRARGTAPIRAAYGNAEREVGRSRSLSGGYSPNSPAVIAKMAREQGQAGSDAMTNVNAGLADSIRQGKLAGLSGMSSMYGSTPGMANMFGNQVLSGAGQSGQFGNEMVNNRVNIGKMPTGLQSVTGALGSIGNLVSGIGSGLGGLGGGNSSGSGDSWSGGNTYDPSQGDWNPDTGEWQPFLQSQPSNYPGEAPYWNTNWQTGG